MKKITSSNFIYNKINKKINNIKILITTRFPPEGGGLLHIGHAKSIFLNIEISKIYNGNCNLRFDDTNPKKNKFIYIKNIIKNIKWLTNHCKKKLKKKIFFTSTYFHKLYQYSELLIKNKIAYIKKIKLKLKKNQKLILNQLKILRKMRDGWYKEKNFIIKIKTSKNPIIYRIINYKHYRTKYNWYIYPMYDYAHSLSDKIEKITYSLCSLEFADHRILYNWIINLLYKKNLPIQIEFSRLNIKYNLTSKRKILWLIKKKYIKNWSDPRLHTINGLKRRGFTSNSINLFCKRIGITKNNSYINNDVLESCIKDDLQYKTNKNFVIINPVKLIIDNYPYNVIKKIFILNKNNIKKSKKIIYFSKELIVEKNNFIKKDKNNNSNYFNFNKNLKLNYSYFIRCKWYEKDKYDNIKIIHCNYYTNENFYKNFKKTKIINWISNLYKNKILIKLYRYILNSSYIGKDLKKFKNLINLKSEKIILAFIENSNIKKFKKKNHTQFEELGYFIIDKNKSKLNKPIFNCVYNTNNIPALHDLNVQPMA